jgi:translation initiation factor 3 subunit C
MSRFFAASDSSSEESSEEELYSNDEKSEQEDSEVDSDDDSDDSDSSSGSEIGAARFLKDVSSDSESEDEDANKVLKSAKDKRFDELEAVVRQIENAQRINDWAVISDRMCTREREQGCSRGRGHAFGQQRWRGTTNNANIADIQSSTS